MQFLEERMGEMNIPLMIVTGAMKMPDNVSEVADAIGVSKIQASRHIFLWCLDAGIIKKSMFKSLMNI